MSQFQTQQYSMQPFLLAAARRPAGVWGGLGGHFAPLQWRAWLCGERSCVPSRNDVRIPVSPISTEMCAPDLHVDFIRSSADLSNSSRRARVCAKHECRHWKMELEQLYVRFPVCSETDCPVDTHWHSGTGSQAILCNTTAPPPRLNDTTGPNLGTAKSGGNQVSVFALATLVRWIALGEQLMVGF